MKALPWYTPKLELPQKWGGFLNALLPPVVTYASLVGECTANRGGVEPLIKDTSIYRTFSDTPT